MIWVVRQFTAYHILDMGVERVRVPIRVEVEYQQEGQDLLGNSVRKKVLYNKAFLLRRYPQLKEFDLDKAIDETVEQEIEKLRKTREEVTEAHGLGKTVSNDP